MRIVWSVFGGQKKVSMGWGWKEALTGSGRRWQNTCDIKAEGDNGRGTVERGG